MGDKKDIDIKETISETRKIRIEVRRRMLMFLFALSIDPTIDQWERDFYKETAERMEAYQKKDKEKKED